MTEHNDNATELVEKEEVSDLEKFEKANKELLLLRAEFENYRKRLQKTTDQKLKYAAQPLALSLLNVYDNLMAMRQSIKEEQTLVGVDLITQSLLIALNEHGIQRIETSGKFNPEFHEIVEVVQSEQEANTILEVVFDGFILHDRVIRAAKVKVSANES